MILKDVKNGTDFVLKSTNQREANPAPLLIQVDSSGGLSIVGGDTKGSFIWRTGLVLESTPRTRFGIPSKMLAHSLKVLKGSKLTLSFHVTDSGLTLRTSSGGSVNLPRVEEPELMRPFQRSDSDPIMALRKGTLSRWSEALSTAFSPQEDSTQFDIDGRVSSTDGYIMFDTHGTLDRELGQPRWVRASFWNALRASDSDATLTFHESGLRVRSGQFEALTNYLTPQRVLPDMKQYYYPDGVTPPVYVVVDKKMFIGQVKAVASTTGAKQQVFLSLPASEQNLVIKGIQTGVNVVMAIKKKGKGWGTIECNAKYLVDILNAIEGREIIISWRENATHPLGIRDTAQQHEWFLLAPVVRT